MEKRRKSRKSQKFVTLNESPIDYFGLCLLAALQWLLCYGKLMSAVLYGKAARVVFGTNEPSSGTAKMTAITKI